MGSRSRTPRISSMSAPASTMLPSAMSPAMPEKQWNQAMVRSVIFGDAVTRCSAGQHSGDGARGAEAVVDADDGHARRAGREHGEQGGDALEGGAVADAGRHG